jgi:hypothetical protein
METGRALGFAWRLAVAVLASLVLSLVVFVLVLAGPVWVTMAFVGRQALMDAPGHGGAIVLLTGSLAFCVAGVGWPIMAIYIFDRLRISN